MMPGNIESSQHRCFFDGNKRDALPRLCFRELGTKSIVFGFKTNRDNVGRS